MNRLGESTVHLVATESDPQIHGYAHRGTKELVPFALSLDPQGKLIAQEILHSQKRAPLFLESSLRGRSFKRTEMPLLQAGLSDATWKIVHDRLIFLPRMRGGVLPAIAGLLTKEALGAIIAVLAEAGKVGGKTALKTAKGTVKFIGEHREEIEAGVGLSRDAFTSLMGILRKIIDLANGKLAENMRALFGDTLRRVLDLLQHPVDNIAGGIRGGVAKAIKDASIQLKSGMLIASSQAQGVLETASEQLNLSVLGTSQEIRNLVDHTLHELLGTYGQLAENLQNRIQGVVTIFEGAGAGVRDQALVLVRNAFGEIDTVINGITNKVDLTIEHAANQVNGIVVEVGNQGHMLVQDTGSEVRATFDHVLADAFPKAEALIEVGSAKLGLTIEKVGVELRSTLYELPAIMDDAGEAFVNGAATGIKTEFLNVTGGDTTFLTVKSNLKRDMRGNRVDLTQALSYIQLNSNLTPMKTVAVYKTLIDMFNSPGKMDKWDFYFTLIGVAALQDEKLQGTFNPSNNQIKNLLSKLFVEEDDPLWSVRTLLEEVSPPDTDETSTSWFKWGKQELGFTYAEFLISKIPLMAAKVRLMQERERALEVFMPKPVTITEVEKDYRVLFIEEKKQMDEAISTLREVAELQASREREVAELQARLAQLEREKASTSAKLGDIYAKLQEGGQGRLIVQLDL